MKIRFLVFFIVCELFVLGEINAQSNATTNTLTSSATSASVQSTPPTGYKLTVQGPLKVWGVGTITTGANTSPSFMFDNRTASTGRKYYFTSGNTGLFQLYDSTAGNLPRLTLDGTGNIGIGTTSPAAFLQIKAGTASAGTAPLKFTSGVNLTTPEAGAFEYDGTNLYFTPTAGNRKTVAFTDMSNASGVLGLANGGTGQNSANASLNALLPSQTGNSGKVLQSNGTNALWVTPAAGGGNYWSLSGNTGTVPGTDFLGTTDAQRLVFKTNNTERLTILANGYMGVSNTAPLTDIDVKGKVGLADYAFSNSGALVFPSTNGGLGNPGAFIAGIPVGTWGNRMDFYARDAAGSLSKNVMSISGEYGNVGIGTTTPSVNTKLDVNGNVQVVGNITSPGTGAASEKFGSGASVGSHNYSLAVGNNASVTGYESVAVGYNAKAAANNVAVGSSAQATGFASTVVGLGATDNGNNYVTSVGASISNPGYFSGGSYLNSGVINIGYNNIATGFNHTYLIGANLSADRTNQMLIGNGLAGGFVLDMVLGGGLSNQLAGSYGPLSIRTTDGSGANAAGMSLAIKGGKSTGSANGGSISFFTTPSGVSGSSINTEIERMKIDATGAVSFNGSFGTSGQVLTSAGPGAAPTWSNAGSGGAVTLSSIGNAPNVNGATIAGSVLNLEPASASFGGVVSTGPQTFAGEKSFSNDIKANDITVGRGAGSSIYNVAVGYQALMSNTYVENTAIGYQALQNNTNGSNNTAIGAHAMNSITTGYNNVAVGSDVMVNSIAGFSNSSLGYQSLRNITGNGNTGVGTGAGYSITSGSYNTFLGVGVVSGITTGSNNTIIGARVSGLSANMNNNIIIADGEGNRRINVDEAGNVGIGTNAPKAKLDINGSVAIGAVTAMPTTGNYKLAVAGDIIAEKVKVKLQSAGWPDYVFDPGYKLPSLSQLETFIKANNHLPEVPSAADIKNNGLDLGDNQSALLKKIEELTLYIIEQNKKSEQQQAAIDKLREQLNTLKAQLSNK